MCCYLIAIGFVLRLFVGSTVTAIPLSMWIVSMTFLLALFLALDHADHQKHTRIEIQGYEHMNAVSMVWRDSGGVKILLLMLATVLVDLLFFSLTIEDAQITFRYALRFAEGYDLGMWNRSGPPVEGFTSLLWTLYLSAFGPTLDVMVYAAKITGILAHMLVVALFFVLYQGFAWISEGDTARGQKDAKLAVNLFKGNERFAAHGFLFTSLALALFLPLAWYASSGMEILLFIALIALVVFLPLLSGNGLLLAVLSVLLILTRPDGVLFAFASALYYWLVTREKKFIAVAVLVITAFVLLTLFRLYYFGHPMPNTYYAKSANSIGLMHIKLGVVYFFKYFVNYFYLFIPLAFLLLKRLREALRPQEQEQKQKAGKNFLENSFVLLIFAGIVLYYLIIAKAGGDNLVPFPFWRHTLNVLPLMLFCSFFAVAAVAHRYRLLLSWGGVLLMPLLGSYPQFQAQRLQRAVVNGLDGYPGLHHDYNNNALLLWLKEISDNDTRISSSKAGDLPLTVDAYHIDALGLNDKFIAHHGSFDTGGALDSKTDMDYVLQQRPDIIEGYMEASKILQQQDLDEVLSDHKKMNFETLFHPIFQREYLIISNAPYHAFDRILFIHKDFYHQLEKSHQLDQGPLVTVIAPDGLIAAARALAGRS